MTKPITDKAEVALEYPDKLLGACPSNRCSNPSEFDFKLGL